MGCARALAARMPLDLDEAYSVGLAEAWRMVPRWQPQQAALSTFLAPRVRGAMLDSVRRMDWVPRTTRRLATDLRAAEQRLEARLARPITDDDRAAAWGVTIEEAAARRRAATPIGATSMHQSCGSEADCDDRKSVAKTIVDPRAECPLRRLARLDLLRLVTKGLRKVPRLAVILHFFEGRTMKEVGRELALSESRISQMLAAIVADLRIRLGGRSTELSAML